jgi:hypothetical protein
MGLPEPSPFDPLDNAIAQKPKIEPNLPALAVLENVQKGDAAALAALEYLKQPHYRHIWGMLTHRQRRIIYTFGGLWGLVGSTLSGFLDGLDAGVLGDLATNMLDALMTPCNSTDVASDCYCNTSGFEEDNVTLVTRGVIWDFARQNVLDNCTFNRTIINSTMINGNSSNTTALAETEIAGMMLGTGGNWTEGAALEDELPNPSYFVLSLLPLATSLFVNCFGNRIATIITMLCVFIASAGTTISAALGDDGLDNMNPSKFMGIMMGMYAGAIATKVATTSISFAYGVQGASVRSLWPLAFGGARH